MSSNASYKHALVRNICESEYAKPYEVRNTGKIVVLKPEKVDYKEHTQVLKEELSVYTIEALEHIWNEIVKLNSKRSADEDSTE